MKLMFTRFSPFSMHQRLFRIAVSCFLFSALFFSTLSVKANASAQAVDVNIEDFQMVSDSTGWLLSGGRLYWTSNHGLAWQDITPLNGNLQIVDTFFLDDQNGWVALEEADGSRFALATTIDGGQSWESTSLDFPELSRMPSAVSAVYMGWREPLEGWLVFKFATGSNFSLGLLYLTQDGGQTWKVRNIPVAEPAYFINAQTGWVAGGPAGRLYRTLDGGESWQEQSIAGEARYQLPIFADELHGILPLVSLNEDIPSAEFYRTEDGGQTWTLAGRVPLEADTPWEISLPLANAGAGQLTLFVPNSNRIVRLNAEGLSSAQNVDGLSAAILELDMVSSENGWARWSTGNCNATGQFNENLQCTRETRLLRTSDGGLHWEPVPLPITGQTSLEDTFSVPSKSGAEGQMSISALADPDTQAYVGQGFDKCDIPTLTQMQNWWTSSPYNAVNLYIGGSARGCANSALSMSFLTQLNAQGWRFIPTWVGPQASCTFYLSRMSSNATTAYNQGVAEADKAVNAAINLGLSEANGSGTVIYYDLEAYDINNSACRNAANAFISGWVVQMRARGNLGGVYGASCGSAVTDWASIPNVPDALWIANWYGNAGTVSYRRAASVWSAACLSDSLWNDHERLRQYAGDHNETWGGTTLGIDSNVLDGPLTVVNGSANQSAPSQPANPGPSNNATLDRTNDTWLSWKTNGDTCSIHIWGGSMDTTVNGNCSLYRLGVRTGGAYSWQVTAVNGFGNTLGPVWRFDIRPHAPANLNAAPASSTKVNLSWTLSADDPSNVDGYNIYAGGTKVASVNKGVTSYQVTNLPCNATRSFSVTALRQGVESNASNTATTTTPTCAPSLISPADGLILENRRPSFVWGAVNEATAYDLRVSVNPDVSNSLIKVRVTGTSYAATSNLAADTFYFWRVRSVGPFGQGDWSPVRSFKTANPPSLPKLSSPANGGLIKNYMPVMNWADSVVPTGTQLDHYQIQIATDNAFTSMLYNESVGESQYPIPSPLQPNSKYYWRVRAFNTLGQYSAWGTRSFRTAVLPPEPVSPSDGFLLNHRRPVFDWSTVQGATRYTLQVSKYANFSSVLTSKSAPLSQYTFTTDLPRNKLLYWRVRAEAVNGPSLWSPVWTLTTGNPPDIPVLLTPANNRVLTIFQPKLDWNDVTAPVGTTLDHYQIQVATNSSFSALALDQDVSISEYRFESPLNINTKYFWRVRSFNADGHYSSWSPARSFRTSVPAPVLSSPQNNAVLNNRRPAFDWQDVTGATSYTIQISKYANFSTNLINANTAPSTYTPATNLPRGVTLYWRVRGIGPNGAGAWSAVFTLVIQ